MSESADAPDHVRENCAYWDARARSWVEAGEGAWDATEPTWGNWNAPEESVHMLPADMTCLEAMELGCGTAYVCAWMARRAARVTGIDNSAKQLATARSLAARHGVDLTLVHGNTEATGFADRAFDSAISEYGACPAHGSDDVRFTVTADGTRRFPQRAGLEAPQNGLTAAASPRRRAPRR